MKTKRVLRKIERACTRMEHGMEHVGQVPPTEPVTQVAQLDAHAVQIAELQNALLNAQNKRFKVDPPVHYYGDARDRFETDLWLFGALNWLQASGVSDDYIAIEATATRFREHALRWWQKEKKKNPRPFNQWEHFGSALKNQFLPPEVVKQARRVLYNIVQGSNESTLTYVTRFRSATARVDNLSSAEEKFLFIRGLKTKLQQEVERDDPEDLETAISLALRLANVYELDANQGNRGMGRGYQGGQRAVRSVYSGYASGPVPMELGMMRGRNNRGNGMDNRGSAKSKNNGNMGNGKQMLTPQQMQMHKDRNLCFRCHRPGHIARRCPNARN